LFFDSKIPEMFLKIINSYSYVGSRLSYSHHGPSNNEVHPVVLVLPYNFSTVFGPEITTVIPNPVIPDELSINNMLGSEEAQAALADEKPPAYTPNAIPNEYVANPHMRPIEKKQTTELAGKQSPANEVAAKQVLMPADQEGTQSQVEGEITPVQPAYNPNVVPNEIQGALLKAELKDRETLAGEGEADQIEGQEFAPKITSSSGTLFTPSRQVAPDDKTEENVDLNEDEPGQAPPKSEAEQVAEIEDAYNKIPKMEKFQENKKEAELDADEPGRVQSKTIDERLAEIDQAFDQLPKMNMFQEQKTKEGEKNREPDPKNKGSSKK
jgi:hypothetical protein